MTGNETTQDKAVRHILDEYGFTPGELYNAKLAPLQGTGTIESTCSTAPRRSRS